MPDILMLDPAGGDHAHSGAYARYSDGRILPAGALAETLPRSFSNAASLTAVVSGTLTLTGIMLPAGTLCTSITYVCRTTAGAALTNQWFGIFDQDRVPLRLTADDTSTAWAANQAKTLALSSQFMTTYSGLHYVGNMVAAGTMPQLVGVVSGTALLLGIAPITNGTSSAGLTTPASCPNPAGAITGVGSVPWAYIA